MIANGLRAIIQSIRCANYEVDIFNHQRIEMVVEYPKKSPIHDNRFFRRIIGGTEAAAANKAAVAAVTVAASQCAKESTYYRLVIISIILIVVAVIIIPFTDLAEVKKKWPQYRCKPQYMMTANMFGYDVAENFNFCINEVFKNEASGVMGPIYKNMVLIVGFLTSMLNVTNSLRLQLATLVGGISNVFQDFTSRINQTFFAIRMSAQRVRSLMYRVYGTLFSFIYMSLSGVAAAQSLGDTTIGSFLQTFCFHPSTKVFVEGCGPMRIESVRIGDRLAGGSRVTAVFRFMADGHPMVNLQGIKVTANHYVLHNGAWIQAGEHPDALPLGIYTGGVKEPLICLNTEDHRIPIDDFVFNDYDETEEADEETERALEAQVNGGTCGGAYARTWKHYGATMDMDLMVDLERGPTRIGDVVLGDKLKSGGKVIGIIRKEVHETTAQKISPSTLLYKDDKWVRAGTVAPTIPLAEPEQQIGLFISPNSIITLSSGLVIRDYIEVLSPDSEKAYSATLAAKTL